MSRGGLRELVDRGGRHFGAIAPAELVTVNLSRFPVGRVLQHRADRCADTSNARVFAQQDARAEVLDGGANAPLVDEVLAGMITWGTPKESARIAVL